MQRRKPPRFEQFREMLLSAIKDKVNKEVGPATPWLEVGDERTRREILQAFKRQLESDYGTELVLEPHLVHLDRPVESVAIQMHHVFNTVYLIERLNDKIRERQKYRY